MPPISTERLFIRHFHILDEEPLYRIFGDSDVMLYGDGVQTKEWVHNWLLTCIERYSQQWRFGPYAVVEQHNQDVVGYCGLFYFADVNEKPEVEIGYRFSRFSWGMGYATEAASAVRDYAFTALGLKRLIAIIDPSNIASIRVAEKIGMHYEQEVMFEGYTHPDHVYVVERIGTI